VTAGDLPVTATATVGGATDEIATDKIATDRFPPAHVATAGVASSDDIAIEVEGLTKSFAGKVVVRNLTMKVRRGLIYGFLGPNGSGKTTTIRMLCGLLTPDSGRGTCLGYDILTQSDQIKSRVGYMTQRFSLYQDLSVRENLEFIARIYGIRDPRGAARAAVARLGLTGREEQIAGSLSGGWKQRLALGACTLPDPQLLLLDEPTAGVDPKARREFWDEIHALAADGLTVLVSTHYMDEAERCHEIAYIAYGELLAQGAVQEVVGNSHLSTYVVTGSGLAGLADELRHRDAIVMVAPFGASLHVSSRDAARLEAAVAPWRDNPALVWHHAAPSLEDVFIELMGRGRDNFQ
jgi:ABC-2 type transport system ATP-binding protein